MVNSRESEKIRSIIAGGCAGLASAILTCKSNVTQGPMDMVKLRLQNEPNIRMSTWGMFVDIWKAEGLAGLYKGVFPTIAGYLPAWAIYFTVYDTSKQFYSTHYCTLNLI
jgi:solute carrier family 25 folate transporter 32